MRLAATAGVLLTAGLMSGCPPDLARFKIVDSGGGPADAGLVDAAGRDAMGLDAPGFDSGGLDATPRDTGGPDTRPTDAGFDGGDAAGRGLDPDLAPASGDGMPCTMPGSLSECPSIEVCRFYTATESRCESCDPCGNLGDPCTRSDQCDILFACFRGVCTNFCTLALGCSGMPEWCVDIGHPTEGVCVIP